MYFILLVIIVIFVSILCSILVSKNEDIKDKMFLERKNDRIYKDFIELSKKDKRKIEYKEYLNGEHWKEIRLKALDRAGNRCQLCCKTDNLNVHHNTYENIGNEDLKDLVVLCRECHAKFHDKLY
ncbi:MAG: HNH endonuclease signature motif containing protein [Clostridium sp.]|uniref:HNH endonuclease n=1 Tax=Clostridium sp. TaxID=1506 RepID=UPI002909F8EF|nr:HNH endonuclease signature motif containing protein [Clostridium sp.]MDU5111970.1 HNH endonuclease signature motif containing protein [Clostridium sp.]